MINHQESNPSDTSSISWNSSPSQEKHSPFLQGKAEKNKQLSHLIRVNFLFSVVIVGISLGLLLVNIFCSSQIELLQVLVFAQSAIGIIIGGLLIVICWNKKKKLFLPYCISSIIVALISASFTIFIIINYLENDDINQQDQELIEFILETIMGTLQSIFILLSTLFLFKMHLTNKHYESLSPHKLNKQEAPLHKKQNDSQSNQVYMPPYSAPVPQIDTSNKDRISDLIENRSQYTDSMIGEIENSLPNNKKKKGLKSIDVLGNTDSEAPNQKGSNIYENNNTNSSGNNHQHGKFMSLNKNEQIYEKDEEQEEDEGPEYVPVQSHPLNQNSCLHSSYPPEKVYSIPGFTPANGLGGSLQDRSYYRTTIDPANL